jgi:hypothetical protein
VQNANRHNWHIIELRSDESLHREAGMVDHGNAQPITVERNALTFSSRHVSRTFENDPKMPAVLKRRACLSIQNFTAGDDHGFAEAAANVCSVARAEFPPRPGNCVQG